jgi:hypothetical protein
MVVDESTGELADLLRSATASVRLLGFSPATGPVRDLVYCFAGYCFAGATRRRARFLREIASKFRLTLEFHLRREEEL